MKTISGKHRNKVFFMTLLIIVLHGIAIGQNDIHQLLMNNPKASSLVVDLKEEIELSVKTHSSNEILITDEQGGEYKGAVLFKLEVIDDIIYLKDLASPDFDVPDDKLSAHKVKDNKAQIIIPENLKVEFYLRSAFLSVSGIYETISINQESGDCQIQNLTGGLTIVSIYAQIHASLPNHKVEISTKEGIINDIKTVNRGDYSAKIEGIYGYIEITD